MTKQEQEQVDARAALADDAALSALEAAFPAIAQDAAAPAGERNRSSAAATHGTPIIAFSHAWGEQVVDALRGAGIDAPAYVGRSASGASIGGTSPREVVVAVRMDDGSIAFITRGEASAYMPRSAAAAIRAAVTRGHKAGVLARDLNIRAPR